jgi:hypothetical protein
MLHTVYRPAGRSILARSSVVICVSRAEASLVAADFPECASRISVIHNGIELQALAAAEPLAVEGRLILAAGWLERYKNVELILAAMRLLPAEWCLRVIGRGPDRSRLEQRSRALQAAAVGHVASVRRASLGRDARYLRVRYEDLIAAPARTLERILTFAGAAASGSPLRSEHLAALRPHHTVAGNQTRFRTGEVPLRLDSRWRCELAPGDRALAIALTGPLLLRHGYLSRRGPGPGRAWSRARARSQRGSATAGRCQAAGELEPAEASSGAVSWTRSLAPYTRRGRSRGLRARTRACAVWPDRISQTAVIRAGAGQRPRSYQRLLELSPPVGSEQRQPLEIAVQTGHLRSRRRAAGRLEPPLQPADAELVRRPAGCRIDG